MLPGDWKSGHVRQRFVLLRTVVIPRDVSNSRGMPCEVCSKLFSIVAVLQSLESPKERRTLPQSSPVQSPRIDLSRMCQNASGFRRPPFFELLEVFSPSSY